MVVQPSVESNKNWRTIQCGFFGLKKKRTSEKKGLACRFTCEFFLKNNLYPNMGHLTIM